MEALKNFTSAAWFRGRSEVHNFNIHDISVSGKQRDYLPDSTKRLIAIKDNGRRFARRNLADPISRIRKLRNRIAHHEPIIHGV